MDNPNQTQFTYRVRVDGMSCGHCKATVEKALRLLPHVFFAEASLERNDAIVRATRAIPAADILKAIEDKGFEPSDVTEVQ